MHELLDKLAIYVKTNRTINNNKLVNNSKSVIKYCDLFVTKIDSAMASEKSGTWQWNFTLNNNLRERKR